MNVSQLQKQEQSLNEYFFLFVYKKCLQENVPCITWSCVTSHIVISKITTKLSMCVLTGFYFLGPKTSEKPRSVVTGLISPTVSPSTHLMGLLRSPLARRWRHLLVYSVWKRASDKLWKHKKHSWQLGKSIHLLVCLVETAMRTVQLILKPASSLRKPAQMLLMFLKRLPGSGDDLEMNQKNQTRNYAPRLVVLCWCMHVFVQCVFLFLLGRVRCVWSDNMFDIFIVMTCKVQQSLGC